MLASLLPGLRDLRTPLAAGYLVLATVYVALPVGVVDDYRTIAGAGRLVGLIVDLGTGPALAVLSFIAYVVGVFAHGLLYGTSRWAYERLRNAEGRIGRLRADAFALAVGRVRLLAATDEAFAAALDKQQAVLRTEYQRKNDPDRLNRLELPNRKPNLLRIIDFEPHAAAIEADLPGLPTRLLGREPEIWSSWDRAKSESEFRVTVSLCLTGFFGVLVWRASPWWGIGVLVALVILLQGYLKDREADRILVECLRSGRLESASLTRLADASKVAWVANYPDKILPNEDLTGRVGDLLSRRPSVSNLDAILADRDTLLADREDPDRWADAGGWPASPSRSAYELRRNEGSSRRPPSAETPDVE